MAEITQVDSKLKTIKMTDINPYEPPHEAEPKAKQDNGSWPLAFYLFVLSVLLLPLHAFLPINTTIDTFLPMKISSTIGFLGMISGIAAALLEKGWNTDKLQTTSWLVGGGIFVALLHARFTK